MIIPWENGTFCVLPKDVDPAPVCNEILAGMDPCMNIPNDVIEKYRMTVESTELLDQFDFRD